MANDRNYIGGGNAAGILGVSPYKTRLQEYLSITGQADPISASQEKFFRRRRNLEPFVLDVFREETGLTVLKTNERYTDPEHGFLKAEIDAETADANVEIKSVHPMAAKEWGEEGADAIPVYVTAQAQHGLMITKRELCIVLAMIGFDDFRVYRVPRDEGIIACMRAAEVNFWQRHIVGNEPPAPANAADVLRLFPRDVGTAVEASTEALVAFNELRALMPQAKDIEARMEAHKDALKRAMGAAARLTLDGQDIATWRSQDRKALNQQALKEAEPQMFERFVQTSSSRVLRLK